MINVKIKYWLVVILLLTGCGGGSETEMIEAPEGNSAPVSPSVKEPHVQASELKIERIIMHPDNFSANDTLKPFVWVHDYITFSGKTVCKWHIDNIEVSNACEYTLKENEHLKPISFTAFVTENGKKSEKITKTYFKKFPIDHLSNTNAKLTLFNDGTVAEWDSVLDGEYAYIVKNRYRKLTENENQNIRSVYSNDGAFAAINDKAQFITWGESPDTGTDDIRKKISALEVISVASAQDSFAALTKTGDVYVLGNLGGFSNQMINYSDRFVRIIGDKHGYALQTDTDKVCLVTTEMSLNCQVISGDIKTFLSLKYEYSDNFAVLTDSGNLYRWRKWNNAQGEQIASDVRALVANDYAYAAIRDNDTVLVWGHPDKGGDFKYDYYSFEEQLVPSGNRCFSSQPGKIDLSEWDEARQGSCKKGERELFIPEYTKQVKKSTHHRLEDIPSNIKKVVPAFNAFAALTRDGQVITWGSVFSGGNIYSDKVNHIDELVGVKNVLSNGDSFTAIKENGSQVSWRGIWDIDMKNEFGEYTKFYIYDDDYSYSSGEWYSRVPYVTGANIQDMAANNGAYLLTVDVTTANNEAFKIYTWGSKDRGAGLEANQYGHTINGSTVAVYSDRYGFTLFTNYGDVYVVSGSNAKGGISTLRHVFKSEDVTMITQ
ncbi:Putative uncharacterized protein [Moritella viscosa]|uniref:Lipoprotein n=1 Tax=Moritella viscosa TaxID=80854 RepID=A0ABY1HG27_9GAMM|nr:Putative uncharacterized protein [Moritella viscosa]SGZ01275.1 Putative uncharacterized protein [Moritella viscosa]SHO28630.1 Putative uncharacterized protein [Moritella viscosa]